MIVAAVADPHTCALPIIVLTARDLTAEDLARLNGRVAATLSKYGFTKEHFVRELRLVRELRRATREGRVV